jgi:hypothetical protein
MRGKSWTENEKERLWLMDETGDFSYIYLYKMETMPE